MVSLILERDALVVVGPVILRRKARRLLQLCNRFIVVGLLDQDDAQVQVGLRLARLKFQSSRELRGGLRKALLLGEHGPQVVVQFGIAWSELDRRGSAPQLPRIFPAR